MTSPAERDAAVALYGIYQRVFSTLCEADLILSNAPQTPWLKEPATAHDELAFAVLPGMLRYRIFARYPEVDTERHEGPPDSQLDADEQAVVDRLTDAQVQRIDEVLLSDCVDSGRKVARVIGSAIALLRDEIPDLPPGFCSRRVQALVAAGRLDSRGHLDHMRFSEVRLARDPLEQVIDAPLAFDSSVIDSLKDFRGGRKSTDLVEAEPDDPGLDLSPNLDRLAGRLIEGLADNPSKRWVLAQFQQSLSPVVRIDEEGRARFGDELRNIMRTLGIESDDGLLDFYLGWA